MTGEEKAEFDCPFCTGRAIAIARKDGKTQLLHTIPTCEEYDKVKSLEDAADFVAFARKKKEDGIS